MTNLYKSNCGHKEENWERSPSFLTESNHCVFSNSISNTEQLNELICNCWRDDAHFTSIDGTLCRTQFGTESTHIQKFFIVNFERNLFFISRRKLFYSITFRETSRNIHSWLCLFQNHSFADLVSVLVPIDKGGIMIVFYTRTLVMF